MANGAAFFDLDRTLLRGASGPVIGESLREAGVQGIYGPGTNIIEAAEDLLRLLGHNLPAPGDA